MAEISNKKRATGIRAKFVKTKEPDSTSNKKGMTKNIS